MRVRPLIVVASAAALVTCGTVLVEATATDPATAATTTTATMPTTTAPPATTTSSTTTSSTTSSTSTTAYELATPPVPYTNHEWIELAVFVGWPDDPDVLSKLDRVITRESRGNPLAWNRQDPGTGSRGLTQINSYWCTPNKYNPDGFLQARYVLTGCDDLFDPVVSLAASLVIWNRSGWQPWGG